MQEFLTRTVVQNDSRIEPSQLTYWTGQWQISSEQLQKAIKATGSNSVRELKEYLRAKGFAL